MGIFVVKKKRAGLFVVCTLVLGAVFLSPGVRMVFQSGNRNLPVYSVEREDNTIALTFNCAWGDEDIQSVLEALDKYNAKATFFLVGQWAEKYPQSAKAIADKGHELGGHSYDHKDYSKLTKQQLEEDITKTIKAIEEATDARIKVFRAPSGSYNDDAVAAIEKSGCVPVQWSVDTIDYGGADCESIFRRATEKTAAGDIILMHTGTDNTAAALPRILDSLGGKFRFSKVSDLLLTENFYVDNAGKMRKNSPSVR